LKDLLKYAPLIVSNDETIKREIDADMSLIQGEHIDVETETETESKAQEAQE